MKKIKLENELNSKIILGIFVVGLLGMTVGYFGGVIDESQRIDEIKQVLYFEELELEHIDDVSAIYENYDISSLSYDLEDYDDVIYYCEESRDISNSYSQKLRMIKVQYPEKPSEILQLRKAMIEKEIEYLFALYQSCEYMESAARAYDAGNYEMGSVNIEGQNEQIELHDSLVEEYYNLDARYSQLKKEMLR